MRISQENKRLVVESGGIRLWIDPWGPDSVRVRMTAQQEMDGQDWALTEPVPDTESSITLETVDTTDPWYRGEEWARYHQQGTVATLSNGKLRVVVNPEGWLSFYNQRGELLTAEYWRTRDRINRYCVPLRVTAGTEAGDLRHGL